MSWMGQTCKPVKYHFTKYVGTFYKLTFSPCSTYLSHINTITAGTMIQWSLQYILLDNWYLTELESEIVYSLSVIRTLSNKKKINVKNI